MTPTAVTDISFHKVGTLVACGLAGVLFAFYLMPRVPEPPMIVRIPVDTGTYGYHCAEGTEFTVSLTADHSIMVITPATSIERITKTNLIQIQKYPELHYEGGGILFVIHKNNASLTTDVFATTCTPEFGPDQDPFKL